MQPQTFRIIAVSIHGSVRAFRPAPRGRNLFLPTLLILFVMVAVPDRQWATAPAAAQCVLSLRTRLSAATTGAPYLQRLSAGGGVAPYTYSLEDGSLPPGLTLSLLGTIAGTPTAEGSYGFTVHVRDAFNCVVTQVLTIEVGCPTMTIIPMQVLSAQVGQDYAQGIIVMDGNAPPHALSLSGALPDGLTFSPFDGSAKIAGTPSMSGSYTFTISAMDANNCVVEKTYTLSVACPALTLSPAELPDAPIGLSYEQFLIASGGQEPYTYVSDAGVIPPGLTLAPDGRLYGVPTTERAYSFHVRADDASLCFATRWFTLTTTQDASPAPIITASYTPSAPPTATSTSIASATRTRTTPTASWTASDGRTATRTRIPTATSSPADATHTASRTPTITAAPLRTVSETATATSSAPATRTPSAQFTAPTFTQTAISTAVTSSVTPGIGRESGESGRRRGASRSPGGSTPATAAATTGVRWRGQRPTSAVDVAFVRLVYGGTAIG
jgi:hypothetical protein